MIAAAIVCAAALSQAATFSWSSATVYGPAAANLSVVGTHAPGSAATDKLMMETLQKSITWSAVMTLTSDLGTDELNFTPSPGASSVGSKTTLASDVIANGTDDNPVKAMATVVLTGTYKIGDTEYTLTSNAIVAEGTFKELTSLAFDAPAVSSWTVSTAAVPEPTSGLLLLLGVGAMALRRRRA